MDLAKIGDTVTVDYEIKFTNGKVYDSTFGKHPIRFKLGDNHFFKGFETILTGMYIGQVKTSTIYPNDAFGQIDPNLIQKIPVESVPSHVNKVVGQRVEITPEGYSPVEAIITHINDSEITLDANPILAGKSLLITVKLVDLTIYR